MNNVLDSIVILYIYMFMYNISLLLIFWTFMQFVNFNFKTIFSFSDFKFNFFFLSIITVSLFSIAGIPPFICFFTKILILLNLLNSNFFFFFIFFFVLLFFALYFYLQNLRFLYSSASSKLNYADVGNLYANPTYFYLNTMFLFIIIFGILFFDDFILYFTWLFV